MSEEKDTLKEELSSQEENTPKGETEDQVKAGEETQEEVDPIAELEKEKRELQDKYVRLYSEFENFRRRTARESLEMRQQASKDLIVELISVLDDFERGMDSIKKADQVDALHEGVELIYGKFKGILEKKGLKPMESKEKDFDLDFHEALTKMPAPSKKMKGKVLDEIEKGYLLHDKVIRHAKVVIAE